MTHPLYALVALSINFQCDVKCHAWAHMEVRHNLQGSRIQGWHWGCYKEVLALCTHHEDSNPREYVIPS